MNERGPWVHQVSLAALVAALALLASGCGDRSAPALEGTPTGPYRLTLETSPALPAPDAETALTLTLTHRRTGKPVTDLQQVHERPLHTFIVARDFSSFAHLHQEDFGTRSSEDVAAGRFSFPYRFPTAGHYRVVAEFTHRDRAFSQHFDLQLGDDASAASRPPTATASRADEQVIDDFTARLRHSPATLKAGRETELVLALARDGAPVTDLELILGAEVHAAIWRADGTDFGHTHSYTPAMAEMMRDMAAHAGQHSAAAMIALMSAPAELVYRGPEVPLRYTFPRAGVYHLFLQCAPNGIPEVFHFSVEVGEPDDSDARIESIVPGA